MREFVKPNIFVSACIEHEACRYDNTYIASDTVVKLKEVANIITACPELAIGLPSPRDALRMVLDKETGDIKLLSSLKGDDYTEEMTSFSKTYANNLKSKNIDGFILKAKSPSCGIKTVKLYHGIGKAHTVNAKNPGFFGKEILETFPNSPIENERRLSNFNIRDQFFIKVFTLSTFRQLKETFTIKKLVEFHTTHKYLFMTLHQNDLKKMGNTLANHQKLPHEEVLRLYEAQLYEILDKEPTKQKRINVLTHIYGYFKDQVSQEEKAYYFDILDDYLNNKIPYSNVLSILYSWTIRFKEPYLSKQVVFMPYPKSLITVTDSGKVM
jgi:uncharacterized protein YbgA (DUF1722 family)/uncharacterized protein YbbK (DUF523 family)